MIRTITAPYGEGQAPSGKSPRLEERQPWLPMAAPVRQNNQNSQNEPGMCPGINSFTFWRLTSASQIGRPGSWSLPDGRPSGGGRIRADVADKGVKRTAHGIMLKENEISH